MLRERSLCGLFDRTTDITEIQLKILQALPSLLQNYAADIRGDLLFNALQICSALQNTKNFAVSNTAAATLQQLVISVYDRVASEDGRLIISGDIFCADCE